MISLKYLPDKILHLADEQRESFDQMKLLETEKKLIVKALSGSDWNQSKAAEVWALRESSSEQRCKDMVSCPDRLHQDYPYGCINRRGKAVEKPCNATLSHYENWLRATHC